MSEQQEQTTATTGAATFPANWHIAKDYNPKDHMMNLKGRDYLNVQNRLLWFLRDQRSFISSGLARTSYVIRTELVELDRDAGFAHFRTYVRDVLGNEAEMYGSEAAKDFPDYPEKASTKSLGRALLALGYGTGFAPEMDEGEQRPVDSPVERRQHTQQQTQQRSSQPAQQRPVAAPVAPAQQQGMERTQSPATEQQITTIRKLSQVLGKQEPDSGISYNDARALIAQLSEAYKQQRRSEDDSETQQQQEQPQARATEQQSASTSTENPLSLPSVYERAKSMGVKGIVWSNLMKEHSSDAVRINAALDEIKRQSDALATA